MRDGLTCVLLDLLNFLMLYLLEIKQRQELAAQMGSSQFSRTPALLCVCSKGSLQLCGTLMGKPWLSCPAGCWTSLAVAHLKIPQLHC